MVVIANGRRWRRGSTETNSKEQPVTKSDIEIRCRSSRQGCALKGAYMHQICDPRDKDIKRPKRSSVARWRALSDSPSRRTLRSSTGALFQDGRSTRSLASKRPRIIMKSRRREHSDTWTTPVAIVTIATRERTNVGGSFGLWNHQWLLKAASCTSVCFGVSRSWKQQALVSLAPRVRPRLWHGLSEPDGFVGSAQGTGSERFRWRRQCESWSFL